MKMNELEFDRYVILMLVAILGVVVGELLRDRRKKVETSKPL
jgi:hypothetical protein